MSRRPCVHAMDLSKLNGALRKRMPAELRESQVDVEDEELIDFVLSVARDLQDPVIESDDWGHAMNLFDELRKRGALASDQKRLASWLVRGRPLIGASLACCWCSYAWVGPWELSTLEALLRRAQDLSGEIDWVRQVASRKLGIFISVS